MASYDVFSGNFQYHHFYPSENLIMAILGYLHTVRTKNWKNKSSATPQMAYKSYTTRYTDILLSFRVYNQIFCSRLTISWVQPSKTLNSSILRYFHTYRIQNFRNGSFITLKREGPSTTPQVAYKSQITRYTGVIGGFRVSN